MTSSSAKSHPSNAGRLLASSAPAQSQSWGKQAGGTEESAVLRSWCCVFPAFPPPLFLLIPITMPFLPAASSYQRRLYKRSPRSRSRPGVMHRPTH